MLNTVSTSCRRWRHISTIRGRSCLCSQGFRGRFGARSGPTIRKNDSTRNPSSDRCRRNFPRPHLADSACRSSSRRAAPPSGPKVAVIAVMMSWPAPECPSWARKPELATRFDEEVNFDCPGSFDSLKEGITQCARPRTPRICACDLVGGALCTVLLAVPRLLVKGLARGSHGRQCESGVITS